MQEVSLKVGAMVYNWTMKCPKCGEEMKEIKRDESLNTKTGKKYSRTIYHCEKDGVWLNLETPI